MGRASPGMGAGSCSQHGGGNRGPRKGAPHQQQRPVRSGRGPMHPHSQGPACSPRAGTRNLPHERMSPSSSRCSSVVDSPNPPALASPAASMVASPENEGSHGGRHYYHQRSAARHGGSGHLTRHGGVGAGAQRQSGGFRSQGVGHSNSSGCAVKSPSLPVQHASGTAQSGWGQEQGSHHRHASLPPPALSMAPRSGVAPEAGNPPSTRPFQRPSTGWIADNVHRNPGALPVATPAGISATNVHVSPAFGPIGSQRARSTSVAGGNRDGSGDGQRPAGAARRVPPGLSPRIQNGNSYLPPATVPTSRATTASTAHGAVAQAEWSDNLDAFATASAVAAGVLSTDDMRAGDVAERVAKLAGCGVADSWGGYSLDATKAAGAGGGARHARWFSTPDASGHSSPRRETQQAAPSCPTARFGEGLAFDARPFVPAFVAAPTKFEGASALDLQQPNVGRAVVGASGAGGSRASGGSRLGFYMSAGGGKTDPASTQQHHGRGVRQQSEELSAAAFGSSYGAAPPPFLAASGLSSLGSSSASGARKAGDFFGFMGDGDDN